MDREHSKLEKLNQQGTIFKSSFFILNFDQDDFDNTDKDRVAASFDILTKRAGIYNTFFHY